LQVRQLVLDPAVQQEFVRLRRELEEQRSTISQLKEQNDSLNFTAVRRLGLTDSLVVIWTLSQSQLQVPSYDCCATQEVLTIKQVVQ
jgi:predicted RNase H-like nuclease (RuvC/YqgF family)